MDLDAFNASLSAAAPPAGLSAALEALWWDAKGDWDKAHDCAQRHDDRAGAHVHAYLHARKGTLPTRAIGIAVPEKHPRR